MSELSLPIPTEVAEGTWAPDRAGDAEARLIEAAKGDPGAFGRLYRRHYGAIAGYLLRRTGDEHLAEDLAAETFIAAWRALPRYRVTGVPFRAWLLRIATNEANAWTRRSRPRRAAEQTPRDRVADGASRDDREVVHAALRTLSPEHQAAVALVHFESLSIERAALVLGVRPGTVKSRLARARGALRVELQRLGALP